MRIALAILFTLLSVVPSHAFDIALSAEYDDAGRGRAVDLQASAGQRIGDYRVYAAVERVHENTLFPNSDRNYRAGVEYNGVKYLKLESGVATFMAHPFGYIRATVYLDTDARK